MESEANLGGDTLACHHHCPSLGALSGLLVLGTPPLLLPQAPPTPGGELMTWAGFPMLAHREGLGDHQYPISKCF